MITVTAFESVPPFAQGLVRDLRVRWALEELGIPYETRLIDQNYKTTPAYLAEQPFGQVPVYQEGDLTLFESGAIVLHIGAKGDTLLPNDPAEKARATAWLIAALNSVEPIVQQLTAIDLFFKDEPWAKLRRPSAEEAVQKRLACVADWLGEKDYLEDRFTVGDLMMTTVLRNLRHTDLVERLPNLKAFQMRCEARPAFRRALDAQMEVFAQAA